MRKTEEEWHRLEEESAKKNVTKGNNFKKGKQLQQRIFSRTIESYSIKREKCVEKGKMANTDYTSEKLGLDG